MSYRKSDQEFSSKPMKWAQEIYNMAVLAKMLTIGERKS